MSLLYRLLGRIASFRPGWFLIAIPSLVALGSGAYSLSIAPELFSDDWQAIPCTIKQLVIAETPPATYVTVSGQAMMHAPLYRYVGANVLCHYYSLNDQEGHVLWVATRDDPAGRAVGPAQATGRLEYMERELRSYLIDKHLAGSTGQFYVDERFQPRSPSSLVLMGLSILGPSTLLAIMLWRLKRDGYTVFARDRGAGSPAPGGGLERIAAASVTATFETEQTRAAATLARSQVIPLESGGVEIRTTAVDTRKLRHTPSQGYWSLSLSPGAVQRLELGRVYCAHPPLPGLRVRYRTETGDERTAVIACDDEHTCHAVASQTSAPNRDLNHTSRGER